MNFSSALRALALASALGLVLAPGASAERVQITVLSTTDLHGHIFPVDYLANRPSADGLAKLATLIQEARKTAPDLILVDSGDTIQGTPLAYYHNRLNNQPPDPMMLAMNALRFDALAIGNHEYNFGREVLDKARHEADFPWLSGNTYRTGTDETAYAPYIIKTISGVRIGILGLTTPGVPSWENPENYAGLEFRDPVVAARHWVQVLRETEQVDLVVVPMHMGLEENLATGQTTPGQVPMENAAVAIAREVPGIDLILMGHTHREVPGVVIGGTLLAQAGRWGDHLIRADLYVDRAEDGTCTVAAKTSRSLSITAATKADPAILALAQPYHDETEAWLNQPIGHSAAELSAADSRLHDTAIIDLIQRAQLDAGPADVSFTAAFNPSSRLPAGDITVREIAGLYVYENTLVTLELSGAQIKAALEHSARYFDPYVEGQSAADLVSSQIPGYNFDIAEGVDYTIDITRPMGDRIVGLAYHGAPLDPAVKLRVAINNYRLNGGGGYTMFKDAPVLSRSSREIRDLIISWVEEHHDIPTEPNHNWRIVPMP